MTPVEKFGPLQIVYLPFSLLGLAILQPYEGLLYSMLLHQEARRPRC